MKIGLISDVHGNIIALENCFKYLKKIKVDRIFFLGDSIGYLPNGLECFRFLINNDITCIKGNHEEMLLGHIQIKEENKSLYRLDELLTRFTREDKEELNKWQVKLEMVNKDFKYIFVHGSPNNYTNGYIYPDTNLSQFETLDYNFIISAHTHRPFIKKQANTVFVNIGSVGLPRDKGNLSSFAILDTETNLVEIKRMELDKQSIKAYLDSDEVHPSVKELFIRDTDTYFGNLIK